MNHQPLIDHLHEFYSKNKGIGSQIYLNGISDATSIVKAYLLGLENQDPSPETEALGGKIPAFLADALKATQAKDTWNSEPFNTNPNP